MIASCFQDLQTAIDDEHSARNIAEANTERASRKIKELGGEIEDLRNAFDMVCSDFL